MVFKEVRIFFLENRKLFLCSSGVVYSYKNVSKFMSVKMYNLRRKTQMGFKVGWPLLKNTMTKTDFLNIVSECTKKKFKNKKVICAHFMP